MKWRKYLKQGIEDWNAAFEEAGFKNAVICKDPPTEEEILIGVQRMLGILQLDTLLLQL